MLFIVFIFALLAVLLRAYLQKCQQFWKNRGVVSTSPNLLLGDTTNSVLGRKNLSFVFEDIYKAFPKEPVVGFYDLASQPNLLVRDLKLIESILVKDFSTFPDRLWAQPVTGNRLSKHLFVMRGKRWKAMRTKLITTFSANKLKSMLVLMDRCTEILDTLVSEKCAGKEVDMKELISRFATDVLGCCVFGLQFNTLTEPDSEYRRIGKIMLQPSAKKQLVTALRAVVPKILNLLKVSEFSPEIQPFFVNLLAQSEEFRKKEWGRRSDLLQLMLDIRDQSRRQINSEGNEGSEEIIDDDTVLSNMFAFYIAGFETTAASLSFCLYELALHPEMQRRLRDEVRKILKANDDVMTYEALKEMKYAEKVISETLRKYTPAGFLLRVCASPYQLQGTGCKLAAGDRVTIPIHALHYDEKYYPSPNEFDPERFSAENIAARPAYSYMPFGDGPRMCLAVRFAKMEMKLCLARIVAKYEFFPCAKTEIPVQFHPRSVLLTSKNGICLHVEKLAN